MLKNNSDDPNAYINNLDLESFAEWYTDGKQQHVFHMEDITSIDQLFEGERFFVFIFLKKPDSDVGHWVLLIKYNETEYEYFDCLANENPSELVKLFNDHVEKTDLEIDVYKLDKAIMSRDEILCGFYCIQRLMCLELNPKEYQNFMLKEIGMDPDAFIRKTITFVVGRAGGDREIL